MRRRVVLALAAVRELLPLPVRRAVCGCMCGPVGGVCVCVCAWVCRWRCGCFLQGQQRREMEVKMGGGERRETRVGRGRRSRTG